MRTLLVDNLDSYTFNLFQLIARVQRKEPVVVRHDAVEDGAPDLGSFDSVVISPGPGHPGNERDFGLSARVLAEATVPVLGVCLGHQGVGLLAGARVERAPAARHGHLARIRHDGLELFSGVPQGFTAVRYHSLCVWEPLPDELTATAWSDDGVLMGLRHRSRPLWGVQFHPESVLTEHGELLMANFRDLTLRHHGVRRTDRSRFLGLARRTAPRPGAVTPAPAAAPGTAAPHGYRLHTRLLGTCVDAEAAFTRRFSRAPHAFWLDSSRVAAGLSRFSFLGDGTGPLAELVRYDVSAGITRVERPGRPATLRAESVFDYLKRELARRRVADPDLPFDFAGGYVGYFGYEMKADCGAPAGHRAPTPDACWLFADRLVVVDHEERRTYLVCVAEDTPAAAAGATAWLDETAAFLLALRPVEPVATWGNPFSDGAPPVEPWLVRDRATYLADIDACRRELLAGESYEICLTNAAWLPAPTDPLGYHRTLRRLNPAPYAAFLKLGDVTVASSSPERFLKIDRDGNVETKPIKGTAPRDHRPEVDARLRDALTTDPKTRAENLMIVDLLRNDLGRVCAVGTVAVPKLMATESYATVHQLVSTVRGTLRDGVDAVDAVRSCFPGGSMTGAPKLRTLEIIDRLETEARGVYSGAIGFLGLSGAADLSIVIRTAVFVGERMHLGAGGAIVLDSDPAAEYDEMLLKTAAPMRAYWAAMAASRPPVTPRPRAGRRHGWPPVPVPAGNRRETGR
jgi:para-aminobenzoate synthetase